MEKIKTILRSKILKFLLAAAGISGSLYSLYHYSHFTDWFFPPLLFFWFIIFILIELISRAFRLMVIAHVFHKKISFWQATWVHGVGDLFAALTPSSIGGGISRFAGIVNLGIPSTEALKIMAVERVALLMALVLLVGGAIGWGLSNQQNLFEQDLFVKTLWLNGALVIAVTAAIIGLVMFKKIRIGQYLKRFDFVLIAMCHQAVKLGLLPLIVYFFTSEIPHPLVFMWSLILGYGLAIVPIPSGGGAIEVAFTMALEPILGAPTSQILVLWRLSGHYIYVILGAIFFAVGSRVPKSN